MGTQKMAKYVAARGLLLLCLLVFIVPAKALKCHSCWGTLQECKLKEVTCPGSNDTCGSSLMMVKSFPIKEDTVMKGCVSSKAPHRSISLSPSTIVKMSIEEKTCDTDLCNKETIQVSEAKENDLNCYSCISSGKDCNSDSMKNLKCRGKQDKCLDIWVLGNLGDITNANLKGCGEMNCSESLMYASRQSSVFAKCCNENFCNSELGFKQPDQTPNGLECISCNTIEGESCSSPNSTTQCYGSLTSCYELAGINMEGGKSKPVLLKGCASPSMCDSSLLPLLANLKGSRIRCCNGSHCNNNFTKDTLQASGYFPETGNQNDRKMQATYIGKDSGVKNPIKTGHAFNNHGSGGSYVSSPNNNDENNNYTTDDERLNTFSVVDVPPVSPETPDGKQNVKGGSWNNDIKGNGADPTFSLYDALNDSNPGSVSNTNPSNVKTPDSLYDNIDQEDQNVTDDSDLYSETTDGNDIVAVSETDIFSVIDIMPLDDDSNLTTTSQGSTKLLGSLDNDSPVSGTNASSSLSDGLNSAPSGSLSNQNLSNATTPSTVNNSLGQQNENSADYSDQDSADQETTDGNVSVDAIESETFYNIEIVTVEDDDNANTTSQEPDSDSDSDSDYASESSYGLNGNFSGSSNSKSPIEQDYEYFSQQDQTSNYDSNLYSGGETFTNNSSTDNYTMNSGDNYPAGVNSNLGTTPQGQKPGGNTTLLSSNTTNSNISSVQHMPNFSSGEYGASGAHGNIPNKTTPSQNNCSSFTGGVCPSVNKTQSQGHSNGSVSAVTTNNFVSHGQAVSSHSGVGNNASNSNLALSVPSTGSGNITMTTSSAYVGNSHNVHKSPVTSQIQQSSHGVFQSSGYTTNVHNMSSALPGNVNGHGNSTSSTGDHAGENRANSSNVLVGSSPPGWHGNTNNSHSMPKDNGYVNGNGSGSGNSSVAKNSEQKPPVGNHNSIENGLYHGNGTNRSNSTTHNNGLSNSMPSAVHNNGSSNGTNSSSSNPSMTSAGGSYNGSSSINHSTLGANQNGSFVGTSSGSKPDNVHSNSNGSNWSNSSVHNPHMLSPGGYNGSYGNNSNFNNSGHSYVGSSNLNSTSGGGNLNHSNSKPNSENGLYLGNGTTRSNSSTHNGSDPTSTGNVHNNSSYLGNNGGNSSSHNPHKMPPGGYYNNNTLNGSNPNITTGDGYFHNSNMMPPEGNHFDIHGTDGNSSSYWNYDPNMLPPVMNGPPEGYFPGNSNYSIYGAEGTSNGNIFMPPGGISHGESNGNQNDPNSSYWNSYPNMPPPAIPGHYSNVGSNIPYHLLPGLNGSTTDNYNNLINMLSNATGLNSTVLSQRLKGVDLNKPGNLAAVLSSVPGFDPNRLSPAMKTAIFGYNNNVSHTSHNTTGHNNHMHPSNWNISNLANNSYFLNVLSNMTNVSIAVLSQKLNEVKKGNQQNLTALLLSLPDFDRYRLPPEFRKEIFGMDTNLNNTNTDGYNHNMVPPGSGSGNNSDSGNFGNNGTSNTSLSGKDTDIAYNGASSLRSKAGVLAIVFTITLLYVTELK